MTLLFSGYFLMFVILLVVVYIYFKNAKIAMQARLLENATDLATEERSEKEGLIKQYDINIDNAHKLSESDFIRERSKQLKVGMAHYMAHHVILESPRHRHHVESDDDDDGDSDN